jgi:hypothetical protein
VDARCVTRQVDRRSGLTVGGRSVSCGCGCGPRMAGGALSLAGMGRGGYMPRISGGLGPEVQIDALQIYHQTEGCPYSARPNLKHLDPMWPDLNHLTI